MADGWFSTPDRDGDRTLAQQLEGLGPVFAEVRGKWVLDVGCAEGLIAIEMAHHGAERVDGIELVPEHVEVAQRLAGNLPNIQFHVGDAGTFGPQYRYDVVLALAILHKLKNPTVACVRLAEACRSLFVVRLPPQTAPVILNRRTKGIPHDIGEVMALCGFALERVTRGSFDEWCGYFRRV